MTARRCESKKRFRSRAKARSFADRTARKWPAWPRGRPYECPDCGWWHLTTKRRGRR